MTTKVETHIGISLKIDKLHGFVLRIRLDIDNLLVKAPVWKGKRVMTLKRALVHLLAVAYRLQQSEA